MQVICWREKKLMARARKVKRVRCWAAVWQLGNVRQSSDSSVWAKISQATLWKTVTIADQAWMQSIDPSQSLKDVCLTLSPQLGVKICHSKSVHFTWHVTNKKRLNLFSFAWMWQPSFWVTSQVLSQLRLKLTLVCAHKHYWPHFHCKGWIITFVFTNPVGFIPFQSEFPDAARKMWTMWNLTNSLQIELKVTAMNQIVDHLKYSWKVKVLVKFIKSITNWI